MKTIGASLELVEPGRVHIAVPLTQQHGYIHGGVISSIADSACGYAAMTLAPSGAEVLTVEFKISLLAPARGERFLALGSVLRSGKRLSFCTAEVRAIRESDGRSSLLCCRPLSPKLSNYAMERTADRCTLDFRDDFHTSTPSDVRPRPPSLILFSSNPETGRDDGVFWDHHDAVADVVIVCVEV
jgi:uncharacterized protein (TIGR00369 family)